MTIDTLNRRFLAAMTVPGEATCVFADAIEPFADSLTLFEAAADSGAWIVQAVLAQGFDRAALMGAVGLAAAANGLEEPRLDVSPLENQDWLARVRTDFPPVRLGRLFLHGSHARPRPGDGPLRLRIDAGTAFGSGEHPTTRGCLMAMQDLAKRHEFGQILDMGCGSGILALAAARLWTAEIVAVDLDPEAVRVARANARINGAARQVRTGAGNGYRAPVMAGQPQFDLIVSNILARPLRRMAPALARSLNPGAYAVLSGLLARQQASVLAAHRAQGLRLIRRYPIGEWQTLVLRK